MPGPRYAPYSFTENGVLRLAREDVVKAFGGEDLLQSRVFGSLRFEMGVLPEANGIPQFLRVALQIQFEFAGISLGFNMIDLPIIGDFRNRGHLIHGNVFDLVIGLCI